MKNATQLHERRIASFLSYLGCTQIKIKNGSILALRNGGDDRPYPICIDLYEEESEPLASDQRFRARAARRFGLPVVYHHGKTIEDALRAVRWEALDRAPVPQPPQPLMAWVQ